MRVLLVSANRERHPSPVVPLGVLSVAGALSDAHQVALVDLCFEGDPAEALARAVERHRPEVIGVGIRNLHNNAYEGTEPLIVEYVGLVEVLRRVSRAPIVLGGAGFSLQPELLLDRIGADAGVVGEGERAFRGLVDALARGEALPRLTCARAIIEREAAATLETVAFDVGLDGLAPPARALLDHRYYAFDGTDNVQTKRGCAFACAYCDYPDLEGRHVRVRDPEAVAEEVLERSRVPGVSHLFFVDSVFNVPKWHALEVCRALERRGSPLPWVCYASPVNFDDELIGAMARAGCVGVEIGSDSGTDAMLARLRKPFTCRDILRARELFLRHNVHDCHTFVLGALDETAEEVRETLAFVEQLNPDVAVFIVFMEDRESETLSRARHREAILGLLKAEAPKRGGWVVPELGIRFGKKIHRYVERRKLKGPTWLHLARVCRNRARGSQTAERPG